MPADKRAVSRDEDLHRLMAEYEIPLRRICCVYLRNADLAADAVQATFLKAYLSLDQYRSEASVYTTSSRKPATSPEPALICICTYEAAHSIDPDTGSCYCGLLH